MHRRAKFPTCAFLIIQTEFEVFQLPHNSSFIEAVLKPQARLRESLFTSISLLFSSRTYGYAPQIKRKLVQ